MIEQAAATVVNQAASAPGLVGAAGIVVSVTLSGTAVVTAIGALVKMSRWMGHTEATQAAQTGRLDEIHADVREIRSALIKSPIASSRQP